MEAEKIVEDDDRPFVTLTLSKNEFRVIRALAHGGLAGDSPTNEALRVVSGDVGVSGAEAWDSEVARTEITPFLRGN